MGGSVSGRKRVLLPDPFGAAPATAFSAWRVTREQSGIKNSVVHSKKGISQEQSSAARRWAAAETPESTGD